MICKKAILLFICTLLLPIQVFAEQKSADITVYMNSIEPVQFINKPFKKDDIIYLPLSEVFE